MRSPPGIRGDGDRRRDQADRRLRDGSADSNAQARAIPIIFVSGIVYDLDHVLRAYSEGVAASSKANRPEGIAHKDVVFVNLYRQAREIERHCEKLRQAERREREFVEAMYEATFEEAPIGIGHAAIDGRWLRANRRLSEILGRPTETLQSLKVGDVVHADDRPYLAEALKEIVAGREPRHRREYRLVRADGSTVWIVLTISLLHDSNGDPVQLTLVEDVSEQKGLDVSLRARTLRELQEAIRARDDLLSISAHELKNPLTPIVLMVTSLLARARRANEPLEPEWLVRHLEPVERGVHRLQSLINSLLEVSRTMVGGLRLERGDVDLSGNGPRSGGPHALDDWRGRVPALDDVALAARRALGQGPARTGFDQRRRQRDQIRPGKAHRESRPRPARRSPDSRCEIRGSVSPPRTRRASSIASSDWCPRGTMAASASASGLRARSSKPTAARFESGASRARARSSLSSCRLIGRGGRADGTIDTGKGCMNQVAKGDAPIRILVVDDDPDIREALRLVLEMMLEGRPHEIVTAANGKEALGLIKEARPSLVLLDLMMPVMSGAEPSTSYEETIGSPACR